MRVGRGTLGQRGGGESRPPCTATGTQGRADRSPTRVGEVIARLLLDLRPAPDRADGCGNGGEQGCVTVGVAGLVSVLGHVAVAVDGAAVARLNVARSGEREAEAPARWTRRVKAQDGMRKGRRDGTALRKAPAFSWEAAMNRTAFRRLDFRTSSMRSSQAASGRGGSRRNDDAERVLDTHFACQGCCERTFVEGRAAREA